MNILKHICLAVCCFTLFLLVTPSCKNDIETINALTSELKLPDLSGFDIEISYTDSGILQGKIVAPEVNKYIRNDEPYYEFPQGMKVLFFDSLEREESFIQANYAIYYENKQLWEARGQVIAESLRDGRKLETEQMFWDQKAKRIYSEKFTRLTNSDGIFNGEAGFEAREDLSKWKLKGYGGTLDLREGQTSSAE